MDNNQGCGRAQDGSIPLVELTTNFSELAPNFAITTFYEEQDTYGVRVCRLQLRTTT